MASPIQCPQCETQLRLRDEQLGKKLRCAHCGSVFRAPREASGQPILLPTELTTAPTTTLSASIVESDAPDDMHTESVGWKKTSALAVVLVLLLASGGLLLLLGGGAAGLLYLYGRHSQTDPIVTPVGDAADFNIAEVRKSVVYIKRLLPTGKTLSVGSGFIASADGLIYTNRHVALGLDSSANPAALLVGVPSRSNPDRLEYFKAGLVYAPPMSMPLDFAILKITARPDYGPFPPLPLAADVPALGTPVAAVGYPAILDIDAPTLSFNKGSISAASVTIDTIHYCQTDAAINSGNSGGPLVNERGQVVGIVTLKKSQANNMGYAVHLSEIQAVATPRPQQIARANPEAGPVDLKSLTQATTIAPREANWQVNQGLLKTKNGSLVLDNDGGHYWMTTRDELPENFLLTIDISVEFLQGRQKLQPTQETIKRCLCLRFCAPDSSKDIMEKNDGYQFKYTRAYLQLTRNGHEVQAQRKGNPDEPFLLTLSRRKGEITLKVDDNTVLRYVDPDPLPRSAKLSLGGYLSRLTIGEVRIMDLDAAPR